MGIQLDRIIMTHGELVQSLKSANCHDSRAHGYEQNRLT
jgi:hypothetical protein